MAIAKDFMSIASDIICVVTDIISVAREVMCIATDLIRIARELNDDQRIGIRSSKTTTYTIYHTLVIP